MKGWYLRETLCSTTTLRCRHLPHRSDHHRFGGVRMQALSCPLVFSTRARAKFWARRSSNLHLSFHLPLLMLSPSLSLPLPVLLLIRNNLNAVYNLECSWPTAKAGPSTSSTNLLSSSSSYDLLSHFRSSFTVVLGLGTGLLFGCSEFMSWGPNGSVPHRFQLGMLIPVC